MANGIIWPTNTKDIIDEIRGTIGRNISMYTRFSGEVCSDCELDILTGESLDPFCPTCSGEGYTYTYSGTTVSAYVNWHLIDEKKYTPAGSYDVGDCTVAIEHSDDILEVVIGATYFVVDEEELYMTNYELRGVPQVNRIIISLEQDPLDTGS